MRRPPSLILPIGNCLIGAVLLRMRFRRSRIRSMKTLPNGRHYYVQTATGERWHYTVVADFLPDCLHWLAFVGRFERLD